MGCCPGIFIGNVLTACVNAANTVRPNLIIVLADDLGYGDLACYGSKNILTPNLDKFASEGLRLTNCYAAAANCSPARTGMMTGRTPWRVGVHNWIPFMSPVHLRESEITVATLLKNSGYTTCLTGKWHLNGMFNLPGQPQPNDHGFDHWFSVQNNALPNHKNPYNFVRNGIPMGPIEGYSADIVVDETIRWLRDVRDKEKPFFTYVCFNEPHAINMTAKKHTDLYKKIENPAKRVYYGNITQLDSAFGRLMDELNRQKLSDNTLVFFTSDNGPSGYGSAGPLRGGKSRLYEGGIRVPGILRWPGHTKPGSTSDEPVSGVDVLPTFCEIAGTDVPIDRKIDGSSFLPVFENKKIDRKTPLYWQLIRAYGEIKVAMRDGDWKLEARVRIPAELADKVIGKGGKGKPGAELTSDKKGWVTIGKLPKIDDIRKVDMELYKVAELTGFELYNLKEDVGETKDLKEIETARFAGMKEDLINLYREVREESPTWPDWTWSRDEVKRMVWPKYK